MKRTIIVAVATATFIIVAVAAAAAAVVWYDPFKLKNRYTPGLDDMMTMMVQPRHIRLYAAGSNQNWELASSEVRNLRASFSRIEQTMPRYLDNDMHETVNALFEPRMKDVEQAIGAADKEKFLSAYRNLTGACNDCHTYLEHPFLVIKVPESEQGGSVGDQDFRPR
jgi:hypothetical protein